MAAKDKSLADILAEAPAGSEGVGGTEAVPVANAAPAPVLVAPTEGLQHQDAGNGLTTATYPGQAPYTGRVPPRQAHWPANYISRSQMTPDQLRADDAKVASISAGIRAESAAFDRGERKDVPSWQNTHPSGAVTRGR